MKLILEGVAVELDPAGNLWGRISECGGIAAQLNGTEIDGVQFGIHERGDSMEITMSGENLSDKIVINYPAPLRSPVTQIGFKVPKARFTANTLNKFMRKANKSLKDKTILIRGVKELSESS